MKRHPSLIPLSRQHHETLILAQLIKKGAPVYRGLPETIEGKREAMLIHFENHLKQHFAAEEKMFLQVMGIDASIDELIIQLREEHRNIEQLIDQLKSEDSLSEKLHQLGLLLEAHIRKEERQLFELMPAKIEESLLASLHFD
jgi:iron-sulfur cluster repair protein YtfE (RIC family)